MALQTLKQEHVIFAMAKTDWLMQSKVKVNVKNCKMGKCWFFNIFLYGDDIFKTFNYRF